MLIKYQVVLPKIHSDSLVFENATVIGDVVIAKNCSVWPYVTIRGDMASIRIGENTNIQESSVIHTSINQPTIIGANVTIGHGAIVHGAIIEDNVLIGMGAIVLDGAVVESGAVVGAGCLVPSRKIVTKNQLVVGNPMKVVKELTVREQRPFMENTQSYVTLSKEYMEDK